MDFEQALAAGMALRIPLLEGEANPNTTGGFDRIIVCGVKSSMPPIDTAATLEQLFDAQHYTNGMSFVPQGTPTNNTKDRPTPGDPPDRTGELSFAIERVPPPRFPDVAEEVPASSDENFDLLARVFGVPNGVFRNLRDAGLVEQRLAIAMNAVLWPTTLGYFMEQLMAPVFSPAAIRSAHDYFVTFVHGRGNFPVFRVEEVPYGVLPVMSLERWQMRTESSNEVLESAMVPTLRRLRQIWRRANDAPRIQPSIPVTPGAPEGQLVQVLSQDASSRSIRIRQAEGMLITFQTALVLRQEVLSLLTGRSLVANPLMADIGHPEWNPRVNQLTFSDETKPFLGPLVAPRPNELAGYLQDLARMSLAELRDAPTEGQPLLYLLVRHALMIEYGRIAREEAPANPALQGLGTEREVWNGRGGQPATPTLFQAFQQPASPSDPEIVEVKVLRSNARTRYLSFLSMIDRAPAEELERLMTETLDTCSHRLDAWISALAARRLLEHRFLGQVEDERLKGSLLGGYAFLEEVRPTVRPTRTTDVGPAEVQERSGGFIHSPSLAHARAAAVLRSGNLAHVLEDRQKYALDLSSERVRRASALLDEVRQGIPLAAALGYRFERAVHEMPLPAGVGSLAPYVRRLRELYHQFSNKSGDDPDASIAVEALAARNVVDGQALLLAHRHEPSSLIPFGSDPQLPAPGTPAHGALVAQLERLEELFDAVSDLLTAESMYQLAQGNVSAAQTAADALANGAPPPQIDIGRARRSAVGVAHRVALVFQESAPPTAPEGWPTTASARSTAEPFLDGWLGQLIGDPRNVVATVRFAVDGSPRTQEVTLAELGLRPLDLLALARPATEGTPGSALDRRLFAQISTAGAANFEVSYGGVVPPRIGCPQALSVVRAAAALLGRSRPLEAVDLRTPADAGAVDESVATAEANKLLVRARAAETGLAQARANLAAATTTSARRTRLIEAARFIPDVFPDPRVTVEAEVAAASEAAVAALDRRLSDARAISARTATGSTAIREQAGALLRAVFGEDFVALAGIGTPPGGAELGRSLADRAALLPGMADAPAQMLQQVARVREPLGLWRKLTLYANALQSPRPRLEVAQLPHAPGVTWAGGPVAGRAPRGRLSLLLLSPSQGPALDTNQPWRGLLLNQWIDLVPEPVETTGLAFHHDGPNSEAGNAILVAVPSSGAPAWSFSELLATLEETFELIELRAIDPDILGLGQLLPGIYLAANVQDATPSTTFEGNLSNDLVIIEV